MKLRGLYAITDSQLLDDGRLLPYVEAARRAPAAIPRQIQRPGAAPARGGKPARTLRTLRRAADRQRRRRTRRAPGRRPAPRPDRRFAVGGARPARPPGDHRRHLPRPTGTGRAGGGRGRQLRRLRPLLQFQHQTRRPAASVELLDQARPRLHLPITAIGGISLDTAPGLIARGVDLVAVIHALFAAASAAEVERRARAFSALFEPA